MKTLVLTLTALALGTTCLYAKPAVAHMQSMIEGQIVYEAPLGAHVKKGQLVEAVDPTQYKADILSDDAAINYDNIEYKANAKLYTTRSVSLATKLNSKRDLQVAIAKKVGDEATLKHCKIYAPFDGTITKIDVYTGSGVGDGNDIMLITKKHKAKNILS
ncbi:MAG TPA: hypothetical protein QF753_15795 [Victivallales bacterium]|nr:hypothetical protein [Victivallales bacterium]